ncbi:MAG: TonB-dependent receptor [Bacteroidia bacterium]
MSQRIHFLYIFLFSSLHAQIPSEDTMKINLDGVVISSGFQAGNNMPVSFTNLNRSDWNLKNTGQEPSFFLSETPSVTFYSDAGSFNGYSYFRLRGIDQTRINMTLDGVPLNEPEDQGVYFSNYPDFLNAVGKIQIQRGAGTSQNGAASYGGSILFSSPDLSDSAQSSVGISAGSFNTFRLYGRHNTGFKNGKGLFVRGSVLHSDGYKTRSGHNSGSIFYSGGWLQGKSLWKITGFAGHQRNELAWIGVPADILESNPRANGNANEDDMFTQSLTQLQHIYSPGKKHTIRSSLYFNYLKGNYDFDYNNFLGLPSTDELYNYAFESFFTGIFSNYTFESENLSWTTGIHANTYARIHRGSEKTLGELYQNTGMKSEFSVFSRMSYAWQPMAFFADIQYRTAGFDYTGSVDLESQSWIFLNPRAGLVWNLNPAVQVYFSLGQTGREPTRNDMFAGNDDLPADSLGAPLTGILDPEFVTDYEWGVRIKGKKISANVNLYYMNFRNEIVLVGQFGPNGLALSGNVEKSYRSGVEMELNWSPRHWLRVNTILSVNRSRIVAGETWLQPVLTPAVIAGQEWVFRIKNIETGIAGRFQSRSFMDFANEYSLKNYFLLNWRGTVSFKKWELTILVNNLTNARYFNNGYVDFVGTPRYFIQAPVNFSTMAGFNF